MPEKTAQPIRKIELTKFALLNTKLNAATINDIPIKGTANKSKSNNTSGNWIIFKELGSNINENRNIIIILKKAWVMGKIDEEIKIITKFVLVKKNDSR